MPSQHNDWRGSLHIPLPSDRINVWRWHLLEAVVAKLAVAEIVGIKNRTLGFSAARSERIAQAAVNEMMICFMILTFSLLYRAGRHRYSFFDQ